MRLTVFLGLILGLLSPSVSAQWQNVGNADYNWGPFHVYSVSLYSEDGEYQAGQRPLMLAFQFAKPVEGKQFAINLVKNIDSKGLNEHTPKHWILVLQNIFPDFKPNDVLAYISLPDHGYFLMNDQILNYDFGAEFNQHFMAMWLDSAQSGFSKLHNSLKGEKGAEQSEPVPPIKNEPEVIPFDKYDINPQLPPHFDIDEQSKETG